jgi:arylsulfate sulfotransferase
MNAIISSNASFAARNASSATLELSNRLPEKRPTPGQGIDLMNETVIAHTAIYDNLLSAIDDTTPLSRGVFTLNPYGTAPLSAVLGFYATQPESVTIEVFDPNDREGTLISHDQVIETTGPTLLTLLGFLPGWGNAIRVTGKQSGQQFLGGVLTSRLPPTDADGATNGFPVINVTVPAADAAQLADGLYFVAVSVGRCNVALDTAGRVRWFTTNVLPTSNFVRLSDGTFLGTGQVATELWKFDMSGRALAFYTLYEAAHHSLQELPDGSIIYPSENLHQRTEQPQRNEDCVALLDLRDGSEITYYDLTNIIDVNRAPRPTEPTDPNLDDWCHLNQAYVDRRSNLVIASCRHQGLMGFERAAGDLVFIMGSHADWDAAFQPYLLQPIDADGTPLYDLSIPGEAQLADREFWNWGQHHPTEVDSGDANFLEFWLFNNGNYRSREDQFSVAIVDNYTECVRFRIDLVNMTVQRLEAYGQELGARTYSSYVGTKFVLDNGNLLVNFGGTVLDNNGRALTLNSGHSDLADPDVGTFMGRIVLQEVGPGGGLLLELEVDSGLFKPMDDYRFDINCFRAYKLSLYP